MKKFISFLILLLIFAFNQISKGQVAGNQEKLVNPDSVKAYLAKARSFVMQGNMADATKIYTRIMESQPDNRDAVQGWLMANMKREPGGEAAAIGQLEELSKSYPNNTGIIFFKAFLNAENNHKEEALKDIEKLISYQPDTAVNYILKGQVLAEMENYKDASAAFEIATKLNPQRFDVWDMKAGVLAKLGKFDDALAAANKGLEIAPNNSNGIYNRACIYSLKGDKTNALADLKKAISMNPSFKNYARQDEDFKTLYDDEEFKSLTL
jgi:tetratricopeptide (TPR) repeat protein